MSDSAPSAQSPSLGKPPVFGSDGQILPDVEGADLTPYNFRNPGILTAADLRSLGVLHQRFVQNLSARLSTFLRMECVLTAGRFISLPFATYCSSLASASHISMFQVHPLRGVGIVDLSLPLGLAMADRLLGGQGKVMGEERTLTEIEVALVEDAVQLILTDWAQLWSEEEEARLRPECIGHETSARFLQIAAPDAVFMMMEVEMSLGEIQSSFSIGIPFSMIEAEVKRMQPARRAGSEEAQQKKMQWRNTHATIAVPIYAEWHVREISLREALQIRAGDVIELSSDLIDQTRLRLNTTAKFLGRVGVQNGCVAVQINGQVSQS